MTMRKFLILSTCLLWAGSAIAADNTVILTPGAGVTMRTQDIGSGVQSPYNILGNTSGTSIYGTAGTSNATVLSVQGIASGTALPISGSISVSGTVAVTQSGTWTVQPGNTANTTAWLVTGTGGTFPVSGTAATGAALAGNPVRIGLSDGTNAQNWLTASALGDAISGTNSASVGAWVWNGATWDRMPGTTAGVTVRSPVAANFLTTATLSAETTKVIGTVNVAAGQSIVVTQGTASNLNATVVGTGTLAVQLTGATNNINNISGTITLPTLASTSTKQSDGSQKTQIVDGSGNVIASTSNNLNVQCSNCSGSGVSTADEASFTAGASLFAGGGGFFQTTATSNALTTGQQGMFQVTANRALFTNLRNAAGTEVGTSTTPLQVSVANTAANGTAMLVTGTGGTFPVTATNLSTNVAQINGVTPLMGNGVTGTGSLRVTVASDGTAISTVGYMSVKVDQTTPGTTNAVSISQINAATTLAGNGVTGTGSQRVTIASDNTAFSVNAAATQSGTWTVQPGNTANTTPWLVTGSGTAGTAATGVVTVQGIASMTPLLATVTATNLSTNVAQINGVTPLMGNGVTGTGSPRVTIVSDGTAISTTGYMSVKLDQTTPGTTNAVSLAQINAATALAGNGASGTGAQRVTISNDNALPTGWASSVAIASTTSGQTGPLGQCAVTTAAPTYTTAQTDPLSCDTSGNLRVSTGTVTVTATNLSTNIAQMNGVTVTMGNGVAGTGVQRVAIASDNTAFSVNAVQSGTWTVQPGNTANTTPWLMTGSGTAGTAATGVLTVQGIASMTPLLSNPGTAANWAIGATGAAVPANAQLAGFSDGTNTVAPKVGAVANVASAAGMVESLAIGQYNATPLTVTDTRYQTLQTDVNGFLKVNIAAGAAAGGTSSTYGAAFPATGTAAGFSDGTNMVAAKVGAMANVTAATNMLNVLGAAQYNATPLTVTDTRYQSLQSDVNGFLKVNVANANTNGQATMANSSPVVIASNQSNLTVIGAGTAGTANAGVVTVQGIASMTPILATVTATNLSTNVAQMNGVTVLMGNGASGTGAQRVSVSNDSTAIAGWGHVATGAAPPTGSTYVGANTGGATGGLVQGLIQCNSSAIYDASTNGSTELVALSSGRIIYVCGYSILAAGTVNVKLIYGTGTACATGPTSITPAFQLTAQVGLVDGSPFNRGLKTIASNALCINTSAGVAAQAIVYYAQL